MGLACGHVYTIINFPSESTKGENMDSLKTVGASDASAGSRTRVYCLEGNYPNRWTTDAVVL